MAQGKMHKESAAHSLRCEQRAQQLEKMATSAKAMLGMLIGEDEYLLRLSESHRQQAEEYRQLAAKFRKRNL